MLTHHLLPRTRRRLHTASAARHPRSREIRRSSSRSSSSRSSDCILSVVRQVTWELGGDRVETAAPRCAEPIPQVRKRHIDLSHAIPRKKELDFFFNFWILPSQSMSNVEMSGRLLWLIIVSPATASLSSPCAPPPSAISYVPALLSTCIV